MKDTTLISVRVPKKLARCLAALAEAIDRPKFYVAAQAIEEYFDLQEWQIKAIRQGVAEADWGKLLDHAEALKVLGAWGRRGA